ncbi:hypothetical protein J6590_097260, partial [Homalodisca vitripennis]
MRPYSLSITGKYQVTGPPQIFSSRRSWTFALIVNPEASASENGRFNFILMSMVP